MKINEIETLLGQSRANIRFYEKEGLISPTRNENGYREYTEEDIAILKKIIIFRKLGLSIPDIKEIFNGTLDLTVAMEQNIQNLLLVSNGLEDSHTLLHTYFLFLPLQKTFLSFLMTT